MATCQICHDDERAVQPVVIRSDRGEVSSVDACDRCISLSQALGGQVQQQATFQPTVTP